MSSRKRFEQWATGRQMDISCFDGFYGDKVTMNSWQAWQSATLLTTDMLEKGAAALKDAELRTNSMRSHEQKRMEAEKCFQAMIGSDE